MQFLYIYLLIENAGRIVQAIGGCELAHAPQPHAGNLLPYW
jgi:hypothetical protein